MIKRPLGDAVAFSPSPSPTFSAPDTPLIRHQMELI